MWPTWACNAKTWLIITSLRSSICYHITKFTFILVSSQSVSWIFFWQFGWLGMHAPTVTCNWLIFSCPIFNLQCTRASNILCTITNCVVHRPYTWEYSEYDAFISFLVSTVSSVTHYIVSVTCHRLLLGIWQLTWGLIYQLKCQYRFTLLLQTSVTCHRKALL
jgi:hypothetical protein